MKKDRLEPGGNLVLEMAQRDEVSTTLIERKAVKDHHKTKLSQRAMGQHLLSVQDQVVRIKSSMIPKMVTPRTHGHLPLHNNLSQHPSMLAAF